MENEIERRKKDVYKKKLEQLIENGGKLISYTQLVPGIGGSEKYPEYILDDVLFRKLEEWYCDVQALLLNMNDNENHSKVGRLPIKNRVIRNGIVPDNVERIRTILNEIMKSLD